MPELSFPLRIIVPEHVHAGVLREIDDDAEPHDRTEADAIARWLGGLLNDAVHDLNAKLPDGFEARIGGHFFASPSLEVARHIYRERRDRAIAEGRHAD